jgi:hypothetical protein
MDHDVRLLAEASRPSTINEARLRAEEEDRNRRRQGRSATSCRTHFGRTSSGVAMKTLMG